jgi:hypothetical protein
MVEDMDGVEEDEERVKGDDEEDDQVFLIL